MNTKFQKLVFATFILAGLYSCQKSESIVSQYESAVAPSDSTSVQNDKVSYAASQQIPDKKFVKTAEVSMEVKDVYEATVHIENALKISADLLPKVNYKVKLSKKKRITLLTKMRFYSENLTLTIRCK